jgi:hypothetical protein
MAGVDNSAIGSALFSDSAGADQQAGELIDRTLGGR